VVKLIVALALCLLLMVIVVAPWTGYAQCTGCYTWDTQWSGQFDYCYFTCDTAEYIPGEPGPYYC